MIADFFEFLFKLVRAFVFVFGLHYLFNQFGPFPLANSLFYTLHIFLFLTSLFMYPLVLFAFRKVFDRAGFAFLASSIFKVLIAWIFLIPFILPKQEYSQNFALQFCIVFSYYLVFESVITIRKLNN